MKPTLIETPSQAAMLIQSVLPKTQNEERVFVIPLDANGMTLDDPILVAVGNEDGTVPINAGQIFRAALKADAEEIILAHNHPSGDLRPSDADKEMTRKLKALAEELSVKFLDHLIIGRGSDFVSLSAYL